VVTGCRKLRIDELYSFCNIHFFWRLRQVINITNIHQDISIATKKNQPRRFGRCCRPSVLTNPRECRWYSRRCHPVVWWDNLFIVNLQYISINTTIWYMYLLQYDIYSYSSYMFWLVWVIFRHYIFSSTQQYDICITSI